MLTTPVMHGTPVLTFEWIRADITLMPTIRFDPNVPVIHESVVVPVIGRHSPVGQITGISWNIDSTVTSVPSNLVFAGNTHFLFKHTQNHAAEFGLELLDAPPTSRCNSVVLLQARFFRYIRKLVDE